MHPVIAVGAVVIRNGTVLLVKRKKAPNKGLWTIPGGRVNFGETILAAAERELWEETTIRAQAQYAISVFELIDATVPAMHFVIVDVLMRLQSGEATARSDASDVRWVDHAAITEFGIEKNTRDLIQRMFADPGTDMGACLIKLSN